MSMNRKYATLPDLDLAPDVYETPDLVDDLSTVQTSTRRSASPASSYQDVDEEVSPDIDRQRLHPDQARSQFSPAQVDADDVDFSDRINSRRRSYRTSTRRRQREDGTEELGDLSDDELEGLEMRLARLRREVEEVKGQFHNREEDKQKATGAGGTNDDDGATFDGMDRLRQVLEEMNRLANGSMRNAEANLAKMLSKGFEAKGSPQPTADASVPDGQSTTYTVTYAPSYQQSHALAKVADFDTRLTMLEKVLGVGSSATFNFEQATPGPILPTLDLLDKQISTLSSSTTSSLDTIGRKVRQLTQEAEKLDEARRSAKAAQDALRSNSSSPQIGNGDATPAASLDDPEYVSKVNALYGTLPTIESFAPLLPAVLDRLRSLQAIHTGAATASQSLDDVEKRQEEMAAEVKRWREGLVQLEGKMKQGEVRMGSNMKAVEGWVKELEGRVEKVSQ